MTDPPVDDDDSRSERLAALGRMLSPGGPPDPNEQAPPTLFPTLTAEEAAEELEYLRGWVEALLARYPHLFPEAVPACWYRHPAHVEALSALYDYERACYGNAALPTDAVRWHRAFRDIEERLRAWTAAAGCSTNAHRPPDVAPAVDDDDWAAFLIEERERRPNIDP
jgi:hypothetical protein